MDRKVLAEQLRECQRRLGHAPSFFIDNLPDETIILSYVVCSNCKGMIADMESVDRCSAQASSHEEFMAFVNEHLATHVHSD
jgi:hypothetical protein